MFPVKPLRAAGPKRGGGAGVAAWFWCEEDDLYVSRAGLTARIEGVEVTRRGVIYSIDTVLMTASLSLYDHLSSGVLTKYCLPTSFFFISLTINFSDARSSSVSRAVLMSTSGTAPITSRISYQQTRPGSESLLLTGWSRCLLLN